MCASVCRSSRGESGRDRSTKDTQSSTVSCPRKSERVPGGKTLIGNETSMAEEDSGHIYAAWLVPSHLRAEPAREESPSSSVPLLRRCYCAELAGVQPPRSPCGVACAHLIEGMSTRPLRCFFFYCYFYFKACSVQRKNKF